MAQVEKQLSEILIEQGLVTADQLEVAAGEEGRTGRSSWKILMEQGVLSERDLVKARALQIGLEFVDLTEVTASPDAVTLVPEEVARRQQALPIATEGDVLVVALAEPRNHLAIEEIGRISAKRVAVAAAYRPDLVAGIESAYAPAGAPSPPSAPRGNGAGKAAGDQGGISSFTPDDLPMVEAPPAPERAAEPDEDEEDKEPNLADFLWQVVEQGASDLHLTAGIPPMVRVHGDLRPIEGYRKLLPKDIQQIVYSMLTQKQREQFEENLELDVSYSLPGKARFRVNVFQQRDALGTVMRLIPFEIRGVEELGLPPAVAEFARLRRGLVLVTGITGSGKSTTLAALIDLANENRAEHIMTVEDPIEFLHQHKRSIVNQREVGTDTQGFSKALKHVLRQDPDIILVGEMRDLETISTALTAAETGHLVFATLHTQDAAQSVDRVIDVFPPHQQQQIRVQLAGTLAGVVSQQLLPTSDGKGRAVVAEVLIATPAVANLIREGKTHQIYTSMQAGGKFGMQVMDQHLAELVKKGRVTYEMALERCHRPEEFNRLAGKG